VALGSRSSRPRGGFTLIEVLVAGVVTAFVLGVIATSLAQVSKAKHLGRERFNAHLRADAALNAMRRDIASVIRADDLFFTRLLITDGLVRTEGGPMDRDEIVVFNTRLRPARSLDFRGEGMEYETQYRVAEDEFGPALWQRRDAMMDEFPLGGGVATPLADGVISLLIEAYDGDRWHDQWDSDEQGLPLAVRVTVTASGHGDEADAYASAWATLRTVISIDRVAPPADLFEGLEPPLPPPGEAASEAGAEDGGGAGGGGRGGEDGGRGGDGGPRGGGGRGGDGGAVPGGRGGGPRPVGGGNSGGSGLGRTPGG
jgi:type II secretion system protein J